MIYSKISKCYSVIKIKKIKEEKYEQQKQKHF